MKSFADRIKLSSSQRNEVQRYLGVPEMLTELSILKIVRKLKEIEKFQKEVMFKR